MPDDPKPDTTFADVLAEELNALARRRAELLDNAPPADAHAPADGIEKLRKDALNAGLVGLALSGGGIRSGTFGLGFLQGLARLRMLRMFDYLSTVSGGGYVGGWLTAWLYREGLRHQIKALDNVERQLTTDRKTQARATRLAEVMLPPDPPPPDPPPPVPTERDLNALLNPARPATPAVVDDEPEPVYHLRAYSNYLAPTPGVLSADSWTLPAIYARNTLVNLLILVPAALAVVLAGYFVVWLFARPAGPWGVGLAGLFAGLAFPAFAVITRRVTCLRLDEARPPGESPPAGWWWPRFEAGRLGFVVLIVGPLVVAAAAAAWLLTADPAAPAGDLRYPGFETITGWLDWVRRGVWLPDESWARFLLGAVGLGAAAGVVAAAVHVIAGGRSPGLAFLSPVILVGVAGVLTAAALGGVLWRVGEYPAAVATVGPPLLTLAVGLAGFIEAAVLSRYLSEFEREWRSRLAAALGMAAAAWLVLFGVVFFLPPLVALASDPVTWTAVGGWAATTVGGLLAAKSPKTGDGGGGASSALLDLLARVAPPVFLVGLLGLLSVAAADLLGVVVGLATDAPAAVAAGVGAPAATATALVAADGLHLYVGRVWAYPEHLWCVLGLAAACAGFALGLSALTDVNVFSMHALYGNRLVRCYLGASRRKATGTDDPDRGRLRSRDGRWGWRPGVGGAPAGVGGPVRAEHPVTGFDPSDDLALAAVVTAYGCEGEVVPRVHPGPYPLVNTALNLVAGTELATQDRRAAAFVLTPHYCGAEDTGYAPTPRPRTPDEKTNLTLGRAMTISGAAADPNMSTHGSAAVTALMTVFNVRLGWWMQNPHPTATPGTWKAAPPTGGMLFALGRELLGLTDEKGAYVHLSDGGHFDNLGVYELVRRRVRFVVGVDAGQDGGDLFEDLGKLIRLVRADFGIPIEIDPTPVRAGAGRLSTCHVTVGRIRYDEVDKDALPGTFVYVRPTRTGDEPADVGQYAATHPEFPHSPTLTDQFFDNDQFEAYRVLGEHVALAVFEDAVNTTPDWERVRRDATTAGRTRPSPEEHRRAVRAVFAAVTTRWSPPPPNIVEAYLAAGQDCAAFLAQTRTDTYLARFVRDLYPELDRAVPPPGVGTPAEVLAANQLLDVMERAWLGIHLTTHHDHPINRGWMNAFRRWSTADVFRRAWPVLRGEYGKDFVRFCERALNLPAYTALPVPVDRDADAARLRGLDDDLHREWGGALGRAKRVQMAAGCQSPPPADRPPPVFEGLAASPAYQKLILKGVVDAVAGRRAELARNPAAADPPPWEDAPQAWLLYLAEPEPKGKVEVVEHLRDYPIGLLAVVPVGPVAGVPSYEVVMWVRPAYRSLGLGRSAIEYKKKPDAPPDQRLYKLIRKAIWDATKPADPAGANDPDLVTAHLWAHYPAGTNTGGEKPQREMWLNFLHEYDFRRVEAADDDGAWVSVRYAVTKPDAS